MQKTLLLLLALTGWARPKTPIHYETADWVGTGHDPHRSEAGSGLKR